MVLDAAFHLHDFDLLGDMVGKVGSTVGNMVALRTLLCSVKNASLESISLFAPGGSPPDEGLDDDVVDADGEP